MALPPPLQRGESPSGISYIATGPLSNESTPTNNKTTLVCIPGWACRAADFIYVFSALAQHNPEVQAYALDLPGHGSTPASLSPTATLHSYAEVILKFIQEQLPNTSQQQRVVLVGHSMGCRITVQTWVQSTEAEKAKIRGIIFLDGSHYNLRKTSAPFDAINPLSASLSVEQKRDLMVQAFEGMCGPATPPEARDAILAHVREMEFEHNSRERKAMLYYDIENLDGALEKFAREAPGRCELLNLQSTGVTDEGGRLSLKKGQVCAWMRHLEEKVPTVRLDVVEDVGHFPHVDRPESVREMIIEFVKTLD